MDPHQEVKQILEADADLLKRIGEHEKAHERLREERSKLAADNNDRAQRRWNRQAAAWRRTKKKLLKEVRERTVGQVGYRAGLVNEVRDQQTTMTKFIKSGQNMAQAGERLRSRELENFKA